MKFFMIFEAVDKATKTMKNIMGIDNKMAAAVKGNSTKAMRATARAQRGNNALVRSMNTLKGASNKAFQAIHRGTQKVGRGIKWLHQLSKALGKQGFGDIQSGFKKLKAGAVAATGLFTSIYGGAGLAAISMIDVASQFEGYKIQLTSLEGSSANAEKAMSWVTNFAAKTPLKLNEVVESFAALRTFGLDPTNGTMQALVDTMAMSGKGADHLSGLTMALGQAWTKGKLQGEEALQLIERGVPVWDMLATKYGKTAAAMQKMASKGKLGRDVIQNLITLMGKRAAGASDNFSKSWRGMVSNMGDLWQKLQLMIMNAGLFDWMKGKLRLVLDTITKMEANGSLKEWATKIGQSIQMALESAWAMAIRVVDIGEKVAGFLSKAASWVGGWENLAIALGAIAFAPTLLATATGIIMVAKGVALLGAALMANPIGLAIAAIAGGVYLIYRNWDTLKPYFIALWNGIKSVAATAWEWLKTIFSWTPLGMIVNNWSEVSSALAAPFEKGKAALKAVWEAIKTLFSWTPLGMIVNNWSKVSKALSSPFENGKEALKAVWEAIKTLFSWTPLGMIANNWSKVSKALSSPFENGKEALKVVWEAIKTLFSWTPLGMITNNWSKVSKALSSPFENGKEALKAIWQTIKTLFDWSPLEALDRTFGGIPAKMSGYFNKATEAASGAFDRLKNVFSFKKETAVDIAVRNPASIEQASAAVKSLEGILNKVRSIDMSGVSQSITKLMAQASSLKGAVQQNVAQAQSFLAGVSFHHHGVRMMDTLAAGMRARAQVVVDQISSTMQQVRNHLPSSPAKVGPLSDIHRLKFGETIAGSIKAEPMIRAMRAASAATMLAASPAMAHPVMASAFASNQTARSLPSQSTPRSVPRSVQAVQRQAQSAPRSVQGQGQGQGGQNSAPVTINYNPSITISGDAASAQNNFKKMLQEHKREIKRMVDEEIRREGRRKH